MLITPCTTKQSHMLFHTICQYNMGYGCVKIVQKQVYLLWSKMNACMAFKPPRSPGSWKWLYYTTRFMQNSSRELAFINYVLKQAFWHNEIFDAMIWYHVSHYKFYFVNPTFACLPILLLVKSIVQPPKWYSSTFNQAKDVRSITLHTKKAL